MRTPKWRFVMLVVTAALMSTAIGCGDGGSAKENALKDAPSETAALYKAKCLNCHGSELQGRVGANTNLQQVGSRMSAAEIMEQIRQGEGVMPGFADSLTEEEIQGLSDWLAGKQ